MSTILKYPAPVWIFYCQTYLPCKAQRSNIDIRVPGVVKKTRPGPINICVTLPPPRIVHKHNTSTVGMVKF